MLPPAKHQPHRRCLLPTHSQILDDSLWKLYPAEPPEEEELEEVARQEAALKAAAVSNWAPIDSSPLVPRDGRCWMGGLDARANTAITGPPLFHPAALQAAQRKRKKQDAAAAAAGGVPAPGALAASPAAAAAGLPAGMADAADVAADAAAAGGKGKGGRAAQEYIPALGSAPYAFLLVMLQARCCVCVCGCCVRAFCMGLQVPTVAVCCLQW